MWRENISQGMADITLHCHHLSIICLLGKLAITTINVLFARYRLIHDHAVICIVHVLYLMTHGYQCSLLPSLLLLSTFICRRTESSLIMLNHFTFACSNLIRYYQPYRS
jgi:hypothetical protein